MMERSWIGFVTLLACSSSDPPKPAPPTGSGAAEPAQAKGFDPGRTTWGLPVTEVAGWRPEWDAAKRQLAFTHIASATKIEVRLLTGEIPGRAEQVGELSAVASLIGLDKVQGVASTRSTAYGWDGLLEGTSASAAVTVFVAVHHHGARSLICWAPVAEGQPAKVSRAEAAKVCATLAPPLAVANDRDRDGVGDVDDACPELAEVRDGVDDDDGCPDSACTGRDACWKEGLAAYQRKDFTAAFAAHRRGCDAGNGLACTAMGDLYHAGKSVQLSYERAAALYRKGCALDNGNGCNNLGWAQERGLGIDRDVRAAEASYAQACKLIPKSAACENENIMRARREGR